MRAREQHLDERGLPAPLGPSSPKVAPGFTRSDIPSTARTSFPDQRLRKILIKLSVSMAKDIR